MPGAWELRPTQPDQAANGQQPHAGRRTAHKEAAAARRTSSGNTALRGRCENASSNQQSQSGSAGRRQPQQQAYDALLLQSFDAAVAAAGDTHSSWLTSGQEASSAPPAQLLSPPAGSATPALPSPASAGSPGSPGTGLLLPHLRSAGAEGTTWLTSTSPTHSSDCQSSPSLAVSCSLSLSLGSPALTTSGSKLLAPPPPGSPVTLQPLPLGRLVSPATTGAVGPAGSVAAWWSPGAARAQPQLQVVGQPEVAQAEQPAQLLGQEQQQPAEDSPPHAGDLSPLAAAALAAARVAAAGSAAAGPSPAAGPLGATPGNSGQRRCRSPFLARDCSGVDVFTPDRYARWVGEQLGPGGQQEGGRRRSSPAGDELSPPSGSAGFRWRDYVDAVEAARMGVSWTKPGVGGDAGGGGGDVGGGGRGLRGALKSVLSWVAGRLGPSHPIELTPSELGDYGSAHSSPAGTPCTCSPAGAEGSHSRYYTPGSGGPSNGGRVQHSTGADRSGSSSVGLHWRLGEAEEEPPAAGGATTAGAAAMPWRGARTLSYGSSEGPSGGGSSAGSCSSSPSDGDSAEHVVGSSAGWEARHGSASSRDSTSNATATAAAVAVPAPPAYDRGHLAATKAQPHLLPQLRSDGTSSSNSCNADGPRDKQQLLQQGVAEPAMCRGGVGSDWPALPPLQQDAGTAGSLLSSEDSEERLYHTPPCCSPQKGPAAARAAGLQ